MGFSTPTPGLAESYFGIPMSHCSLAVLRGASYKYVQFRGARRRAAAALFRSRSRPRHTAQPIRSSDWAEAAFECAQALLQWRMRNDERILSQQVLSSDRGLVVARDLWR